MVFLKFSEHLNLSKQAFFLFNEAFDENLNAFNEVWKLADLEHSYFLFDQKAITIVAMCLNLKKKFISNNKIFNVLSLSFVCVAKQYQKKGYSKKLLNQTIKLCENEFDYLFLQFEEFKYYAHLNFYDAVLRSFYQINPNNKINYNYLVLSINSNIDWKLLFKIFNASQKLNSRWVLSLNEFIKYCTYKLFNQEIIVLYKDNFCFVYDNKYITAHAYTNSNDFQILINSIKTEKLIWGIDYNEYEVFKNLNLNLIEINKNKIILQTNKPSGINYKFNVWNFFI